MTKLFTPWICLSKKELRVAAHRASGFRLKESRPDVRREGLVIISARFPFQVEVVMIFRLLVSGFFLIPSAANCDWLRQAAGLTAELERRYPDSRIEIDDAREDGGRRIEVRIVASSFEEDRNLAEEARMIAQEVRRRYELHGPRDRVKVDFRSERRNGPFASTREASFTYPASALNASD